MIWGRRKKKWLTERDRYYRLCGELGYDPDIAERNCRLRITMLEVSIQQIADVFEISRPLVHYRMRCQHKRPMRWMADVLVVSVESLCSQDPVGVVTEPMPPPGWLRRIRPHVGFGLPLSFIQEIAWERWSAVPLDEPAFFDQDDPLDHIDPRGRRSVLKKLT